MVRVMNTNLMNTNLRTINDMVNALTTVSVKKDRMYFVRKFNDAWFARKISWEICNKLNQIAWEVFVEGNTCEAYLNVLKKFDEVL